MPDDREPKQTTEKGLQIPVPMREEWERNMRKVAPPPEPAKPDEPGERD